MKCIDAQVYYDGKWGFAIGDVDVEGVQRYMKALEIEIAMLMPAMGINYDFVQGNRDMASDIAPYDNLRGYVYVNGHYPEISMAEMEKYLPLDQFVGVKYHPGYSRLKPNAPQNDPMWELLVHYDKVLFCHTWYIAEHGNPRAYSLPIYVTEIAKKYPNLRIITAHMAGPGYMEAIYAAKEVDKIWIDTCSSHALDDKIRTGVRILGANRILFGSGMTEGNAFMQKAVIMEADITEREREMVLYENAKNLFML